jgi:hypothetical protein
VSTAISSDGSGLAFAHGIHDGSRCWHWDHLGQKYDLESAMT